MSSMRKAKDPRSVVPFQELTKREKYLYDNPFENVNYGYGGYYKWCTKWVSPDKRGCIASIRVRTWFWRDKPPKRK